MPTVELPDGTELDFPDGMTPAAMQSAIESQFPQFAAKKETSLLDKLASVRQSIREFAGTTPEQIAAKKQAARANPDDGVMGRYKAAPAPAPAFEQSNADAPLDADPANPLGLASDPMVQTSRAYMNPTRDMVDAGGEARARQLVRNGMNGDLANQVAFDAAARGVMPGRELGANAIQKTDFDFEARRKYNEDPFFKSPGVRGAIKGYEGYIQGLAGLNQFAAEAVGANDTAANLAGMAKQSRGFTDAMGESPDHVQRNFEGAVSSIAQQLPAMLGGAATGSSALTLGAMFTQAFGSEYSTGRAAGQTEGEAATRAGLMGAFEVVGEKFGLGQQLDLMRNAARGVETNVLAKWMANTLTRELPGEMVTTTGQFGTDKLGAGIGLKPDAGLADYLTQMGDTATQTIMQGGLMGAATGGVNQASNYLKDGLASTGTLDAEQAADKARRDALGKWGSSGLTAREPSRAAPSWAEASGATPPPSAPAPTIADIGAAGSVDEAIAAAQAVVSSSSRSPHATAADIDALEAQYAEKVAGPRIPINDLDGIDLTAGIPSWEAANAEAGLGTDAGAAGRGSGAGIADALGAPDGSGIVDAGRLPDAGSAAGAAPGQQAAVGGVLASNAADAQPALSSRQKALQKIARQEEAVRLAAENIAARKAAKETATASEDDDWHGFPADTGTLDVPRSTMPQIKAEHRGALTQFLNARGITHEQVEIPSGDLKPTQAEFSLGKVRKAMEFTGGDRSILASSDGHVLDGHHQWLAKVEQGQPVKAIRLNAPILELLETVKEFPSAGVDTASAAEQSLAAPATQPKKPSGGQRARERIKTGNPFLAFLASRGVSSEDRSDAGAERGRAGNPMVPGYGPVFRKSGLRFDELALAAQQAGFLTQADIDADDDTGGTRKLADMIARATQNKEVIRQSGSEEQVSADDRLVAEAEALGLDTNGATPDALYDMVVAAHAALEEHRAITGAASVDEQAEIEQYADTFTEQEAALLLDADIPLDGGKPANNLTDEELDAIFGKQSGGKTEESTAQPARESAAGTQKPGDILGSYTREEVVARQDADAASVKAREAERARLDGEARKKRDKADIDARMDASADNFQLGQDAETSLSGQQDIFSAPAPADDNSDIPPAFYKKVKVPIEVYIEDEGAYETVDMPADKALASVREDIDNLRALVKCMGGKA